MRDVKSIDRVLDMFRTLAENEYSLLWGMIEDFTCNGHEISVKDSHQFNHVIIDNAYYRIGGNVTIGVGDKTYTPLEYIRIVLERRARI